MGKKAGQAIGPVGRAFAAILPLFAANAPAHAQTEATTRPSTLESAPPTVPDEGTEVVPYLWAPTIAGNIGLGPISVPVRVTPSSVAGGVKAGFMGYARRDLDDRFAYGEVIAIDFGDPTFAPFFGQPVVASVLFTEVGAGLNRKIRLGRNTVLKVSPYAGFQHLYVEAQVSGALATRAAGSWSSPFVGVTAQLPLSPRFSLDAKIDAAGFGLGRIDYRNLAAALEYRLSRRVGLAVGFRSARGNYLGGPGLSLDLKGNGPLIALRYRP